MHFWDVFLLFKRRLGERERSFCTALFYSIVAAHQRQVDTERERGVGEEG